MLSGGCHTRVPRFPTGPFGPRNVSEVDRKGWGESGRPARWEAASSLLCLSSSFLISWSNRSLIRFSSRSSVVRSLVTYSLPVPFALLTRRGREPNERREWGTDRGSWWAAFTVTHAARPSWVVCSHRSLPYGVAPRSVGSFHSPPSRVATVGSGARWRDEQREERNRPVMEVRKEGTEGMVSETGKQTTNVRWEIREIASGVVCFHLVSLTILQIISSFNIFRFHLQFKL